MVRLFSGFDRFIKVSLTTSLSTEINAIKMDLRQV